MGPSSALIRVPSVFHRGQEKSCFHVELVLLMGVGNQRCWYTITQRKPEASVMTTDQTDGPTLSNQAGCKVKGNFAHVHSERKTHLTNVNHNRRRRDSFSCSGPEQEQGRIHGYPSRMRVGRGHNWGKWNIWEGAIRLNVPLTPKK